MWRRKTADRPERNVLRCSFCNKRKDQVEKLIAGPQVFICGECVEVCNDIIADDERVAKSRGSGPAERVDDPVKWPHMIECALCRIPIATDEGVVITGNRGILCPNCMNAVEAAQPRLPPC